MVDADLVRRKLSRLNVYLEKLAPIMQKKFEDYVSDFYLKTSAERLIQLIVECAADVNNHVLVETKNRPAEDYSSSFVRAAEIGLISKGLAFRLKSLGGMRNILVHEYMEIDDEKVYNTLPEAVRDFKQYMKEAYEFIKKID